MSQEPRIYIDRKYEVTPEEKAEKEFLKDLINKYGLQGWEFISLRDDNHFEDILAFYNYQAKKVAEIRKAASKKGVDSKPIEELFSQKTMEAVRNNRFSYDIIKASYDRRILDTCINEIEKDFTKKEIRKLIKQYK